MEKKEKRTMEKKKEGAVAPSFKSYRASYYEENISCVEFSFEEQVLQRQLMQELQERGYRDWQLE